MPIAYKELLTLHYNTYKAAALNSKVKETSRNPDLDPAIYGKYVKFQSAFKVRLQYLSGRVLFLFWLCDRCSDNVIYMEKWGG